jgi:hypothetical protein
MFDALSKYNTYSIFGTDKSIPFYKKKVVPSDFIGMANFFIDHTKRIIDPNNTIDINSIKINDIYSYRDENNFTYEADIEIVDNNANEYYKYFGHNEDIDNMCDEYLKGFQWIANFYFKKESDNDWYYKYLCAPLLSSIQDKHKPNIVNFKKEINMDIETHTKLIESINDDENIENYSNILANKMINIYFILYYERHNNTDNDDYNTNLDKYTSNDTANNILCASTRYSNKCLLKFMRNYDIAAKSTIL